MGSFDETRRDLIAFSEKNFFYILPLHTIKEWTEAHPPALTVVAYLASNKCIHI
jgi:hypothetical protein